MWQPREIQRGEGRTERGMRLWGTWLGGAQTDSLGLYYARPLAGNREVRSQVVGEDRSRLSWEGKSWGNQERRKMKKKSQRQNGHRFSRIWEKEMSMLPACFSLGFSDDRRSMSGSGDARLTIFITFISGSKSFTFSAYRFFHFGDRQA